MYTEEAVNVLAIFVVGLIIISVLLDAAILGLIAAAISLVFIIYLYLDFYKK